MPISFLPLFSGNFQVQPSKVVSQQASSPMPGEDQFIKTAPEPQFEGFRREPKKTQQELELEAMYRRNGIEPPTGGSTVALPSASETPKERRERVRKERQEANAAKRANNKTKRFLEGEEKNLGLRNRRPGAEVAATAAAWTIRAAARSAGAVDNAVNNAADNGNYVRDRERELKQSGIGSADARYIATQEARGNGRNAQRRMDQATKKNG